MMSNMSNDAKEVIVSMMWNDVKQHENTWCSDFTTRNESRPIDSYCICIGSIHSTWLSAWAIAPVKCHCFT